MNWKNQFKPHILGRGFDYYKEGRVAGLAQHTSSVTAVVHGSETYSVEIMLSGDKVMDLYCDCPYADGGENCKHMAAVLYAVEGKTKTPVEDVPDWNAVLDTLSEKTLRELVRGLAVSDEALQKRLVRMALGRHSDHDQWEADLEQIIDCYADRDGFLDYEDAYGCMLELTEYLEDRLPALLDSDSVADAAALTELVYATAFEQEMDDSDGGLSHVSWCCCDAWRQILAMASSVQKEEIFASLHRLLEQNDWGYGTSNLEDVILSLDWPPALWQKHLAWIDENMTDRRLRERVSLMQDMGADTTEVMEFLERNRAYESAYGMLCSLYEQTDIRKAIHLVQAHRSEEESGWQQGNDTRKLMDLFEKAGDAAQYEKELRYLILECGRSEVEHVKRLKAVTDSKDWRDLFINILNTTSRSDQRMALLQFEGMYDVLLEEVTKRNDLSVFLRYEHTLRPEYPQQTLDLYVTLLKEAMRIAYDRSSYHRIAAHLKKLDPYPGGQAAAKALAQYWYSAHNNRPAMKDELKKAGYEKE